MKSQLVIFATLLFTAAHGAATAGVQIGGDAITFGDGSAQNTAGGPELSNTINIPADGTPTENGAALLATINQTVDAAPDSGYLIKLEPGTYDLGTSTFSCRAYVDLEGSGRGRTVVTSAVGSGINATIQSDNDDISEIRDLTVQNTHSGSSARAIGNRNGGQLSLFNVGVLVNATVDNAYGVITLADSKTKMKYCSVEIGGLASGAIAIYETGSLSKLTVDHCDAVSRASVEAIGVALTDAGTARLTNSSFHADGGSYSYGVLAGNHDKLRMRRCEGTVESGNSTATVIGHGLETDGISSGDAMIQDCYFDGGATPGENVSAHYGTETYPVYCWLNVGRDEHGTQNFEPYHSGGSGYSAQQYEWIHIGFQPLGKL